MQVSLLKELIHPCIVRLEKSLYVRGELYLVCEYMDNDLKKYMDDIVGNMRPELLKSYAYRLIESVRYCHAHRILHRDLKPQNILIGRNGRLSSSSSSFCRLVGMSL